MPIVRWEPFHDLVATQERFNRLFNQAFSPMFGEGTDLGTRTWAPPVDIYETNQNLVVQAELPGVDPNQVEVRVENNTLYLKGERRVEGEVKEGNYHRRERAYGTFTRSFTLPSSVKADNVAAEYKDGVLTVTLPKREEAKPKTIRVQVSEEAKTVAARK